MHKKLNDFAILGFKCNDKVKFHNTLNFLSNMLCHSYFKVKILKENGTGLMTQYFC